MSDYIYKKFKMSYQIVPSSNASNSQSFIAEGEANCLLHHSTKQQAIKFQTISDSYHNAESQLKKLLENYVNFELKSAYNWAC